MALRLTAKFITTAEAAERVGATVRRIQNLCREGQVPGATRFGNVWMVPSTFRWKPQKRGRNAKALKRRRRAKPLKRRRKAKPQKRPRKARK